MNDNEMLLEDENNFYIRTGQTANRRMRLYNRCLELKEKYLTYNVCVIIMLVITLFMTCLNLHYMSEMNSIVNKYVPEVKKNFDDALIRFNKDSDQIQNVSDIINSDEFQNSYHKINDFVSIISIDDMNKINELLNNIDPKEVGELIHVLCKSFGC